MKRSRTIYLKSQQKPECRSSLMPLRLGSFLLKPLALATAAIAAGCSQQQETLLVKSVDDCTERTALNADQCQSAYQQAMAESERSGPRFSRESYCEEEFGRDQCRQTSQGSFIPFMAGFLVANALDAFDRRYYHHPAYEYRGSRYRDKLILSDGSILGRSGSGKYSVPRDTLKTKMPKATRTVSRGGFGSKASAKSNWGGGSRSRGWGG